ncbi:uncharacterized protein LOC119993057 [Tripterygium wilfordii]|uniref:uncharacterized protein LOC119993057 n=1 Tax=Tripterygium wilfordii TaxID=458696 RepID=UPI0018F84BB9|nr:uncharacterized protein LOC119993057 [Tripterygium wilfordii]
MSCSTTKSMMQLKRLWVHECAMMASIVECAGESETEDDIIFHQLEEIYIYRMPNLSSFCGSGKHAFKLPSLKEVTVENCPRLKTFCEGPLSTFKLWSLHVSLYKKRWNGDLNTTIQALYKEMDDDDDAAAGDEQLSMRFLHEYRRLTARRHFNHPGMSALNLLKA